MATSERYRGVIVDANVRTIFLLGLLLTMSSCSISSPIEAGEKTSRGLLHYSEGDVQSFLDRAGYSDFGEYPYIYVSRNSDGSEVRIASKARKQVLVVSAKGSITEINVPGVPVWLNDSHKPVAWIDWPDNRGGMVHYWDGTRERISQAFGAGDGPEASGRYFVKQPIRHEDDASHRNKYFTSIFSVAKPNTPVAQVNNRCQGLFAKNDQVVFVGKDTADHHNTITMYYFRIQDNSLEEVTNITANVGERAVLGWEVLEVCPWSEEILLKDKRDFPSRGSRLYVFNLRTHEIKKVGREFGGWHLFLQSDILCQHGRSKTSKDTASTNSP